MPSQNPRFSGISKASHAASLTIGDAFDLGCLVKARRVGYLVSMSSAMSNQRKSLKEIMKLDCERDQRAREIYTYPTFRWL